MDKKSQSRGRVVSALGRHLAMLILGPYEVVKLMVKRKKAKVPNHFVVHSQALHRGGQPSSKGMKQLKEMGIKTVICVRNRNQRPKMNHGMLKIYLPFNPFKPSKTTVVHFLRLVRNRQLYPIYLHCFHGLDRTGMLCAIYRIAIQDWSLEEAIREMKSYGFHSWHAPLEEFIRGLNFEAIRQEAGLNKIGSTNS